jgi:hypothetical protein
MIERVVSEQQRAGVLVQPETRAIDEKGDER